MVVLEVQVLPSLIIDRKVKYTFCDVLLFSRVFFLCSNWPTFPQVFIKGEFIGGSDIVLNMHQVNTHFKSFYIFLLVILNSCLTILDIM